MPLNTLYDGRLIFVQNKFGHNVKKLMSRHKQQTVLVRNAILFNTYSIKSKENELYYLSDRICAFVNELFRTGQDNTTQSQFSKW